MTIEALKKSFQYMLEKEWPSVEDILGDMNFPSKLELEPPIESFVGVEKQKVVVCNDKDSVPSDRIE